MKIKWYGHACFRIEGRAGGDGQRPVAIVTDPYTPEVAGYDPIAEPADIVIMSSATDRFHSCADRVPGNPTVINSLEIAALTTPSRHISKATAEESIQKKAIVYDRQGDAHYDVISAFIKSIRGSDPDAALFWLARMLEAGEDPRYVARRMVVHASEDIGLADPRALLVAVAAAQAVEYVGLPEARLNLAEAAIYLARAPKSNSVITALGRATEDAASVDPVPLHLKEASGHPGLRKLGYGKGYKYPHDYPGHRVEQEYRPVTFEGKPYYEPSDQGEEGQGEAHPPGEGS